MENRNDSRRIIQIHRKANWKSLVQDNLKDIVILE